MSRMKGQSGMFKNSLIKTVFLVGLLGVMLAVVVVAMCAGTTTKGGHSQTLLEQFVVSGGWIVWFILLPMSVVMVYLAAEYGLTIRRGKLLPNGRTREIVEIIQQYGTGQFSAQISGKSDLVSVALVQAISRSGGDAEIVKDAAAESLQEQGMALFRRIEWLNLIGNVAPMVGLFGTVVGMIELFNAIVNAGGQPQPAQLAHGISVALVTTFWGLLIAIPALAVHGVFRNRIETIISNATVETEVILLKINRPASSVTRTEPLKQKPAIEELPARPTARIAIQQRSERSAGRS
jgi:biopolymer transport protein ExbB